ncbi:hypothetical protein ACFL6W_03485 [Thermodesulfobacteriota bacterium]
MKIINTQPINKPDRAIKRRPAGYRVVGVLIIMKSIIFTIIALCVTSYAYGLVIEHEVNSSDIDNFPIFVLIDVNDENASYRIHLRDTGKLKGLESIHINIKDENKIELFSGALSLTYIKESETYRTDFRLSKEKISGSSLGISSSCSSNTSEYKIPCVSIYYIKLQLIYDKFSGNKFIAGEQSSYDESPAFYDFLNKKFINNRQKSPQQLH